jgi:serine/threonine-protein kinase
MMKEVLGKLIADKYRIESLVSESDAGDVYSGRHEVLDKPVTIKMLSPALAMDRRWVERFVNEARAATTISHPNILNITDFGTDARGYTYAVFENADGRSLTELLREGPELDEKRAVGIARQIASAVSAAHARNVLHGRLSPEQIYVNTDPAGHDVVKVIGFGSDPLNVARDADPRYLAPEQLSAFPAASERSDVYTLGVMLYEMLSGARPFEGATAAEVLAKQNSEPPPPLSAFRRDLHADIEPIVLAAIAIDPERRYQTIDAFAEDLDILSGTVSATSAKAAAASGHNVWKTAFVALLGIGILSAILIYATSARRTDPTTQLQADAGSMPVQPIGPATGAQEESLARLPAMTEAEIMANENNQQAAGMLPGGDGYNAWANGGVPPPGAPLNQGNAPPLGYVPPGGQVYTIDPNGGSQFMPPESGVILVPVPANTNTAVKPSPTPKGGSANTAQPAPTPGAAATPKPLATPPPKTDKPATQPGTAKPPAKAPAKPTKPGEVE